MTTKGWRKLALFFWGGRRFPNAKGGLRIDKLAEGILLAL